MDVKIKIILAGDHHEGEKFSAWLSSHGFEASVGSDSQNHVSPEQADEDFLNDLWDRYCSEYECSA